MFRAIYFKFLLYFWDPPGFITSPKHGSIHKNIFRDQLSKILVWSYHKSFIAFFFSLFRKCSNHIIGFKAFLNHDGDMHCFQNTFNIGNGNFYSIRCNITIGFVIGKSFFSGNTSSFVKTYCKMVGTFSLYNI